MVVLNSVRPVVVLNSVRPVVVLNSVRPVVSKVNYTQWPWWPVSVRPGWSELGGLSEWTIVVCDPLDDILMRVRPWWVCDAAAQ